MYVNAFMSLMSHKSGRHTDVWTGISQKGPRNHSRMLALQHIKHHSEHYILIHRGAFSVPDGNICSRFVDTGGQRGPMVAPCSKQIPTPSQWIATFSVLGSYYLATYSGLSGRCYPTANPWCPSTRCGPPALKRGGSAAGRRERRVRGCHSPLYEWMGVALLTGTEAVLAGMLLGWRLVLSEKHIQAQPQTGRDDRGERFTPQRGLNFWR